MGRNIIINASEAETRLAIIEGSLVQEIHTERTKEKSLVGNVYVGKVDRILPSMQAAFVSIGRERNAFLHVNDVYTVGEKRPIENVLYEGQLIRVQVIKDEISSKGARLSMNISITGHVLVMLLHDSSLYFSKRLQKSPQKALLKKHLTECIEKYGLEQTGFIIRSNAIHATAENVKSDFSYLLKIKSLLESHSFSKPILVWRELDLAERSVRDFVTTNTLIKVDNEATFNRLQTFSKNYIPEALPLLYLCKDERAIFDLFAIEDEINRALQRRVELKSGGYLVFDQAEAMTVIDVNSGACTSGRNLEEMVYKTNMEAVVSLTRQLRLRNIGGIIIVDFIDMEDERHSANVLYQLRLMLAQDVVRTEASDFSAIGLVEITRHRNRESLSNILCEPCTTCQGRREIKSVRTICYDIFRELMRESMQFKVKGFRIIAARCVIEALLDEEAEFFKKVCATLNKEVSLHIDDSYAQEYYEINLC